MAAKPAPGTGRSRIEGIGAPAVRAWLKLARVYHKVGRVLDEDVRKRGLSPAQFDMLAMVGRNEGITQQELAEQRVISKSNVTQVLDRMRHMRLISRLREGKYNRLYLTEEGRRLLHEVTPPHLRIIERQLSALSQEEQSQLLALLDKLEQSAGGAG